MASLKIGVILVKFGLWLGLLIYLSNPAPALAAKCTRDLPPEVLMFFGEDKKNVDCDDYEYKEIDLQDDKEKEIAVSNFKKSCEGLGYCNFEIFAKSGKNWTHIATIPGRFTVLPSLTNGYHDLSLWLLGHKYVYGWSGTTYVDINTEIKKNSVKSTETKKGDTTPVPAKKNNQNNFHGVLFGLCAAHQ